MSRSIASSRSRSKFTGAGHLGSKRPHTTVIIDIHLLGQVVAFTNIIIVFGIPKKFILYVSLGAQSQAIYAYHWDHIMSLNFSKPMSNRNVGGVRAI